MLLDHLQRLTGFSDLHFSTSDIIHEFHSKFSETFLFINGQLHCVYEAIWMEKTQQWYLKCANKSFKDEEIQSLEVFKPAVGLFFTSDNNLIYFQKTAKKMWKKSFSIGENYTATLFNPETGEHFYDWNIHQELLKLVEHRMIPNTGIISLNRRLAFTKGKIYFNSTKVGSYGFNNPRTTSATFSINPLFNQELIDFLSKEIV